MQHEIPVEDQDNRTTVCHRLPARFYSHVDLSTAQNRFCQINQIF